MTSVYILYITVVCVCVHSSATSRKILRLFYEVTPRTLVSPAADVGSLPLLPSPPPFIVFLIRVKVKDCECVAKKPNELHDREAQKTQFQFQFGFRCGFVFRFHFQFPISTLISTKMPWQNLYTTRGLKGGRLLWRWRQQLHLTLTCDKFGNN